MRKVFKEAADEVVTKQVAAAILKAVAKKALKEGDVRAAKFVMHAKDGRPETWINHTVEVSDAQQRRLESIFQIEEKTGPMPPDPEPNGNGNGHLDHYRS